MNTHPDFIADLADMVVRNCTYVSVYVHVSVCMWVMQVQALDQPVITVSEAAHNIKLPRSIHAPETALTLPGLLTSPAVVSQALTTLSHLTVFGGLSYAFAALTAVPLQYALAGFASAVFAILFQ